MTKSTSLICILLLTTTNVGALTLDLGSVVDCTPLEQQFVIEGSVNNQTPITNPEKKRFTVIADRALSIGAPKGGVGSALKSEAKYVGDENFNSPEGDIKVSKWSNEGEYKAAHHLYFAMTKDKKLVLEERISKDQFKRMFVITYACEIVALPAPVTHKRGAGVVGTSVQRAESHLGKEQKEGAVQTDGILNKALNAKLTKATSLNEIKQEQSQFPLAERLICKGESTLRTTHKGDQSRPIPTEIKINFDQLDGRLEVVGGWDKFTEGGVVAWIDSKENKRINAQDPKSQSVLKPTIYATLDSKENGFSTYFIIKKDSLVAYVKFEKTVTGESDTFEGICTPAQ